MLYDKIKSLCDERNMSIRALERDAYLAVGTIAKWKSDISNPTYMSVIAVSKVLGISPSKLMQEEVDKYFSSKLEN